MEPTYNIIGIQRKLLDPNQECTIVMHVIFRCNAPYFLVREGNPCGSDSQPLAVHCGIVPLKREN